MIKDIVCLSGTMKIDIINITGNADSYRDLITSFLSDLDGEKEYFPEIEKCIKTSELILVAVDRTHNGIVGISGAERIHGIARSYVMIKKDYQGDGIGKRLYLGVINEVRKRGKGIVMAFVEKENIRSLKMHIRLGYRMVGSRWKFFFLFKPLTFKGMWLFYLIKMIFPLIVLKDSVYDNIYLPRKMGKRLENM